MPRHRPAAPARAGGQPGRDLLHRAPVPPPRPVRATGVPHHAGYRDAAALAPSDLRADGASGRDAKNGPPPDGGPQAGRTAHALAAAGGPGHRQGLRQSRI
ncbi:MAG: hypothetical protein AMJ77_02000 [Dehalococcoidia bacterium SM23_28_2]|nr:MAG: hypothetical protein AMJ77_02000 [Dehalococcoidia bacterium SM23_28_2]